MFFFSPYSCSAYLVGAARDFYDCNDKHPHVAPFSAREISGISRKGKGALHGIHLLSLFLLSSFCFILFFSLPSSFSGGPGAARPGGGGGGREGGGGGRGRHN